MLEKPPKPILEQKFDERIRHPSLKHLLPVIQGLLRFRPSDRISASQALEMVSAIEYVDEDVDEEVDEIKEEEVAEEEEVKEDKEEEEQEEFKEDKDLNEVKEEEEFTDDKVRMSTRKRRRSSETNREQNTA